MGTCGIKEACGPTYDRFCAVSGFVLSLDYSSMLMISYAHHNPLIICWSSSLFQSLIYNQNVYKYYPQSSDYLLLLRLMLLLLLLFALALQVIRRVLCSFFSPPMVAYLPAPLLTNLPKFGMDALLSTLENS